LADAADVGFRHELAAWTVRIGDERDFRQGLLKRVNVAIDYEVEIRSHRDIGRYAALVLSEDVIDRETGLIHHHLVAGFGECANDKGDHFGLAGAAHDTIRFETVFRSDRFAKRARGPFRIDVYA